MQHNVSALKRNEKRERLSKYPEAGAHEQIHGFLRKKQSSHPEDVCLSRGMDIDTG